MPPVVLDDTVGVHIVDHDLLSDLAAIGGCGSGLRGDCAEPFDGGTGRGFGGRPDLNCRSERLVLCDRPLALSAESTNGLPISSVSARPAG